ncbi:hypothetical protein KL934_004559 [Ogataea polymorpha]|nr:hypothetical protein KL934_004559 [Ogataea polymorpha]
MSITDGKGTTYVPVKDSGYIHGHTEHLFLTQHHDWGYGFLRNGYLFEKFFRTVADWEKNDYLEPLLRSSRGLQSPDVKRSRSRARPAILSFGTLGHATG